MELWFTEYQTPGLGITCKTTTIYHSEKTDFQDISLIDTEQFGRMLVLDGTVQTTIEDEFVYHEMITHVPLFTHKNPERVLVIGGGEGGAVREILKHPTIKKVVLVEIDSKVVEVCKKFMPEISGSLDDSRVELHVTNAISFLETQKNNFDIIILDSTDPIGPSVGLFAEDFYRLIFTSLKEDGIFVAQTESPFFHKELIKKVFSDIKTIFPITKLYTCSIPTYPSGFWSFAIGSKKYNPIDIEITPIKIDTKYYSHEIHKAAFVLPKFLHEMIK